MDDPIISMLRERGLTEDQIDFLIKTLVKIRTDSKDPTWDGADASVKAVLAQKIDEMMGDER